MPTNYPENADSFSVPDNPSSVSLSSAGDSARTHTQSHQDLGDAITALQTFAALVGHDHSGSDGSPAGPTSKLLQVNTHQSPDTDSSVSALHHTLGAGASQASRGTHTHNGTDGTQLSIANILNLPSLLPVASSNGGNNTWPASLGGSSFSWTGLSSSDVNYLIIWSACSDSTSASRSVLGIRINGHTNTTAYGGQYLEFRTDATRTGPSASGMAQIGYVPTLKNGSLHASGITLITNWNVNSQESNILTFVNENASSDTGSTDPALLTGLYSTIYNPSGVVKNEITFVMGTGNFAPNSHFTSYSFL